MKKRDFTRLLASVTALTLAAPALAQENGSVRDFELPSDQETPRSRVQGPVLEGIPAPRVARPSPAAAPPPVVAVDPGASSPAAEDPFAAIDRMARSGPAATPTRTAQTPAGSAAGTTSAETTAATETVAGPRIDLPSATAPETATAASAPSLAQSSTVGLPWWAWLAALLVVGALGTLAGWVWRGRSKPLMLAAPVIERPRVSARAAEPEPQPAPAPMPEPAPEPVPVPGGERAPVLASPPAELPKVALTRRQVEPQPPLAPKPQPQPAPVAAPEDEDAPESPLRIALEPARLSVSLLNATLAYRILLTNQGEDMLRDISIDGDMVSAHASLSQEEQLAAPNSKLENRHLIRTLAPGETKVVNGDFALPLPLIRPIRKGEATLFVPLARLRIVAGGEHTQVVVQTSVVGQRSDRAGGGLRPFRLDLGPRIYSELGQRAFA
jgi:hypothetical protein